MTKNQALIQSVFLIVLLIVLLIEPSFAGSGGEPWDGPLEAFIETVTGTTGTLLAGVAVIATGVAALAGKFSMGLAARIIGGIVLVFGGVAIANFFIEAVR